MKFTFLQTGLFVRRYKRFLVDVELESGELLTLHCPNTGAMTGCMEPGAKTFFSESNNKKRKFPHTVEWFELSSGARACVNTQRPNTLVEEAIKNGTITQLQGYEVIQSERRYGQENSRIDLLLSEHDEDKPDCYVEVKNVTLCEHDTGYFPDAISLRALKHIRELLAMVKLGHRAALVFCINHSHIKRLKPADKIHLDYGKLLREAAKSGLELYAYQTEISREEISIVREVPIDLDE